MSADRAGLAHFLENQAEKFRSWDRLRRAVWVFDPHYLKGVYANPAAMELWGSKELNELLARDFSSLSPAVVARTARLAQATESGGVVVEPWTFFPNGRPVTVQATISTIFLDEERPVLLFEASPLEMEPEERRATEALRHTSTLITLFGSTGDPIFSNPAAFMAYGVRPPRFEDGFLDPALGRDLLLRVLAGEIVGQVCEMRVSGDSRWRHLDIRKVLDPATGEPGVLLTEIDVTERIQAEQARVAAEQKAAMAEARGQFLTDMSHDLRTPLNAVIGFSALLTTSDIALEQLEQAERIHESGVKLLSPSTGKQAWMIVSASLSTSPT